MGSWKGGGMFLCSHDNNLNQEVIIIILLLL